MGICQIHLGDSHLSFAHQDRCAHPRDTLRCTRTSNTPLPLSTRFVDIISPLRITHSSVMSSIQSAPVGHTCQVTGIIRLNVTAIRDKDRIRLRLNPRARLSTSDSYRQTLRSSHYYLTSLHTQTDPQDGYKNDYTPKHVLSPMISNRCGPYHMQRFPHKNENQKGTDRPVLVTKRPARTTSECSLRRDRKTKV